jgi:two-component system nitrogen regulation response regulator NtrX
MTNPTSATWSRDILEDEGYVVAIAENAAAAREARRAQRPDLILLDIWMPDTDGITLLKEWSEGDHLPCPDHHDVRARHGRNCGGSDPAGRLRLHRKPLSMAKLLLTVERALDADRLARENQNLRRQQRVVIEPVGRSEVVQRLRAQVLRVAQHDAPVLIFGEPGTGKEVYARFLHAHSPRRAGPFVDVGVGSIARENASLELFGSEQGDRIHYGRLEQASGGTLFLDELADMDLEAQSQAGQRPGERLVPANRRQGAGPGQRPGRRRHPPRFGAGSRAPGAFAKICTTSSTWSQSSCRRCAITSRMCPNCSTTTSAISSTRKA